LTQNKRHRGTETEGRRKGLHFSKRIPDLTSTESGQTADGFLNHGREAKVPAGFDRVVSIQAIRVSLAIALQSANGKKVEQAANLSFLEAGPIQ
jgi:hypothetical protein